MAKQEYLQLAHTLNLERTVVIGRYMSEKLDGQRFMWDGGAGRGSLAKDVPYANTQKDDRYLMDQPATGLWSRYGKAIQAPDWWLDQLPPFPVEGELWTGYGEFQRVSSIVRRSVNVSDDWQEVRPIIFDAPPAITLFRPRRVHPSPSVDFTIKVGAYEWWLGRNEGPNKVKPNTPFRQRIRYLQLTGIYPLPQTRITSTDHLNKFTDQVLDKGGEGSIIKAPNNLWVPERDRGMLKYKPYFDAEGVVTGWTPGKGKLEGLMGSLILESGLKLSGFTDEERTLGPSGPVHFPNGTVVTYKYRELTDSGIPKEARYYRGASN